MVPLRSILLQSGRVEVGSFDRSAMPTAAEVRAKAEELRVKGQSGALPGQAAKKPFQRAGAAAGSEDRFEKLLRFSLYQATSLDRVLCASNIVFVLFSDQLQQGMEKQSLLWDQSKPEQPNAGEGKFVAHPLGDKRTLMFCTMIEALMGMPFAKAPEVHEALKTLEAMDVDVDLKVAVGAFAPRHSTPKQGRPWVWELSVGALASDDFRKSLTCLIAYLQQHKSDAIKIEPHRMGPTGLRQALWDDLKTLQGQRAAS